MAILTLLLVFTAAWIIYHFIIAYRSRLTDKTALLRKLGYGKTIGLFALIVGILGQMVGLTEMFAAIQELSATGEETNPELVFGGIRATMIVTIYGTVIYLFSLLLWFVASTVIDKKQV